LRRAVWPIGGCTFAESPDRDATRARIIWRAALDPGALAVTAAPGPAGPDAFDPVGLARWLTVTAAPGGGEHAVLSDGFRHIRLDVARGTLRGGHPVRLSYLLSGVVAAQPQLLSLRRLLALCRLGRFAPSLFPVDRRMRRWLDTLRVHDALAHGASQREIAEALFGRRLIEDWRGGAESLRSRVRRMVRDARHLGRGGYRRLMLGGDPGAAT